MNYCCYCCFDLKMLQALSQMELVAVMMQNSIWTSVDLETAALLDRCCTGQQDGGPDTAKIVNEFVENWKLLQPTNVQVSCHWGHFFSQYPCSIEVGLSE
jgi:hypothetical protein